MTDLPEFTHIGIHGDDAVATGTLVVAGFTAIWLVDEIYTPELLESYRRLIRSLKEAVSPEAALRVMRVFARAHPRAQQLLTQLDVMRTLPW